MKFFLIGGLTMLLSGTTVFVNNLSKANEKILTLQKVHQNINQKQKGLNISGKNGNKINLEKNDSVQMQLFTSVNSKTTK